MRCDPVTTAPTSSSPLFSFGVISDIQYADIEPASNFGGGEHREYRASVEAAEGVLEAWLERETPLAFIAQLGDLIDGQNAGGYGQGLEMEAPQSQEALARVLKVWDRCSVPIYHAIGNHELYNFSWAELRELMNQRRGHCQHQIAAEEFYFSFSPVPGWRVIFLNSYQENIIKPVDEESFERTERLLSEKNPNYGQEPPFNFFEGLSDEQMRFVPFNGGFGAEQLAWLEAQLEGSRANGERVIIGSHLPINPAAASVRNIAFDADEALKLLGRYLAQVALYLAGHRHGGGYAQQESGAHHLTVQAPLTHGLCGAVIEVYADELKVCGLGQHRSYRLAL